MASRDHLAKYARPIDSVMRELALFERRVDAFSGSLERVVRNALESEADAVSADWIDQAKEVLEALRERPDGAAKDQADCDKELAKLRTSLAKNLGRDLLKPSSEEVSTHTKEIARTALEEWMTRLTRAHLESPRDAKVFLNADALPGKESLAGLLSGVEAFGVPPQAVATVLIEYVCEVLVQEKRFPISEELYLLEDMTSRNYLLVVEGTAVKPAPFPRRLETLIKELLLGEELSSSAVLPREPAMIGDEVFRMTQVAQKLMGRQAFRSAPLERLAIGSVALSGALALHPQLTQRMDFMRLSPPTKDPVFGRFCAHFAAVAECEPKYVTKALKVVLKTNATATATAKAAAATTLMQSVYTELKTSLE